MKDAGPQGRNHPFYMRIRGFSAARNRGKRALDRGNSVFATISAAQGVACFMAGKQRRGTLCESFI